MKGVSYDKQRKRWSARVTIDGKRVRIGRYRTKEEAEDAVSVHTSLQGQNSFDDIKLELEKTPVTRPFRISKPTLFAKLKKLIAR